MNFLVIFRVDQDHRHRLDIFSSLCNIKAVLINMLLKICHINTLRSQHACKPFPKHPRFAERVLSGVIIHTKGLSRDQLWSAEEHYTPRAHERPPPHTTHWYLHLFNSSWYCKTAQKDLLCVHSSHIQTLLQKCI